MGAGRADSSPVSGWGLGIPCVQMEYLRTPQAGQSLRRDQKPVFGGRCWANGQSRSLGPGLGVFSSPPSLPGPRGGKDLGNWPWGGVIQLSTEKEQSSDSEKGRDGLTHLETRGLPGLRCPGAKCQAEGGAPGIGLPTSGQGSGSELRRRRERNDLRAYAPFPPSLTSPYPSCVVPVQAAAKTVHCQDVKRGLASDVAQIPAPPQALSLPGSGPGAQQMLLLGGFHVVPHALTGSGTPRAEVVRWALRGAHSPAGGPGAWGPGSPAGLPAFPAPAVLGLRGRRPAAAAAPDPPPHAERSGFPAPAGFIRPLPPRVKLSAPRRVQKPVGKGEGRPAAKGAPARSPSTSPSSPGA